LHRARDRLVGERTALINQLRAAADVCWWWKRDGLRFGALQAVLSIAVFVGVSLVLALVPWPRDR
jgi:hypothetical protein